MQPSACQFNQVQDEVKDAIWASCYSITVEVLLNELTAILFT